MTDEPKPEVLESEAAPETDSGAGAGDMNRAAFGFAFWWAVLIWLIVLFVPYTGLLWIFFIPFMIWLIFKKKPGAVYILLLSPFFLVPVFCWNMGVFGYVTGTGKMIGIGLMIGRSIDRQTRAQWTTLGCEPWGYEPMILVPNNLAIYALTAIFGPMRGAYDGPYPSPAEATEALKHSKPVEPYFDPDAVALVVELDGEKFLLTTQASRPFMKGRNDHVEAQNANAVLLGGRCLILDVTYSRQSSPESIYRMYYLLDAKTGLTLTQYNPEPC